MAACRQWLSLSLPCPCPRPQSHQQEKVIIYFMTCACVDLYSALLARLSDTAALPLRALHGRMKQAAREAVLADFTDLPAGKPSAA